MKQLDVKILEPGGSETPAALKIKRVLLAGYTGRDRPAVMEHIRELEKIGVAPPPKVPMVYEVKPEMLTTAAEIEVGGPETSGEVEVCLVQSEGGILIGLGSDHTDRRHEAIDVAESKTLCQKVVSTAYWPYEDVRDHWDSIEIRSWVYENGVRRIYQEGTLGEFMTLEKLLDEIGRAGYALGPDQIIFGGTIATRGGLVCSSRFEAELHDPILGRSIALSYDVHLRP